MAAAAEQDDDLVSGINITPFVDVVLVLLVIFMVTARLESANLVMPNDLPAAASGQAEVAQFSITIDAHDQVAVDGGAVVPGTGLRRRAAEALQDTPGLRAVIAASSQAHYATIAAVMDDLRQAGVTRIGFAVQPSPLEASP